HDKFGVEVPDELLGPGNGLIDAREHVRLGIVLADQGRVRESHCCGHVSPHGLMTSFPVSPPSIMSWNPLWMSESGIARSITGRVPVASSMRSIATSSDRVQPVEPRMRCCR